MKKIVIALTVLLAGYTGAYAQTATTTKTSTTTHTTRVVKKDGTVVRKTTTKTAKRNQVADPNETNGSRFPTGTYQTPTGTQPDYNASKRAKTEAAN